MTQHSNHQKTTHVLVVDDDFATRLLYREALEPAGFEVNEAEDGLSALEQYKLHKPDIILLDVIMPKMNGFETCEALKQLDHWTNTPIIMVTGLDDIDSIEKSNTLGATDFITKPINWPILKHRLNFILKANYVFNELKKKETQLNNAQRIAKIGSWECDVLTRTFTYSKECLNICNIKETDIEHLVPENFLTLAHPDDRNQIKQTVIEAWQKDSHISFENRLHSDNDNTEKHIRTQIEFIRNHDNQVIKLTGTIQDISASVKAEAQIRHLAYYDSLTGLPNRQFFLEQLKLSLKQAQRQQTSLYIMFLDLDNFKKVNDSLGHDAGDLLLREFSTRLQSTTRDTDFTAHLFADQSSEHIEMSRLGGDEFTILLHNVKEPRAAGVVAKRIIKSLVHPFDIQGHKIFASTSIGISSYPNDGNDAETLLKHADLAMYHAKSNGKNNYQFFNNEMNQVTSNRLSLENEIRSAIEHDEFFLLFQPKIELITGKIIGVEALIRWQHPKRGLVMPNDFISLAEESRLILPLGEWVLKKACEQIRTWENTENISIPVSVNISPYQFYEGKLEKTIHDITELIGVRTSLLELEITENVLMKNLEYTIPLMKKLRKMGIRLAIDDFGTGYSVLNTLRYFPLDVLKVDQAFIQGLPQDKASRVISEAIIHMADGLQLDVVAEGVETKQQLEFLLQHKSVKVQGYYFSKPVSAEEITRLIAKHERENSPT